MELVECTEEVQELFVLVEEPEELVEDTRKLCTCCPQFPFTPACGCMMPP